MELKLWMVFVTSRGSSDWDDEMVIAARSPDEAFAIARQAAVKNTGLARYEIEQEIETFDVWAIPDLGDKPGVRRLDNCEHYKPGFSNLTTLAVENGEA